MEFDVEPQRDEINEYFEEIDEVMFTIQAENDRLDAEDLADVAGDTQMPDAVTDEGAEKQVASSAETDGPSQSKGKYIAAPDSDDGIDDAPMTIYKLVT